MQHIEPEPDWREAIQRRLERLRFEPARVEEIVDELAEHLQDRYEELIAGGRAREEAVRETLAELDDDEGLLAELAGQPRRAPEVAGLALGRREKTGPSRLSSPTAWARR